MYIAIDLVVALLVYLFFPETAKMSIEEISMVMDYPLKEGRQRVLEVMEERRAASEAAARNEALDEDAKGEVTHVEGVGMTPHQRV